MRAIQLLRAAVIAVAFLVSGCLHMTMTEDTPSKEGPDLVKSKPQVLFQTNPFSIVFDAVVRVSKSGLSDEEKDAAERELIIGRALDKGHWTRFEWNNFATGSGGKGIVFEGDMGGDGTPCRFFSEDSTLKVGGHRRKVIDRETACKNPTGKWVIPG